MLTIVLAVSCSPPTECTQICEDYGALLEECGQDGDGVVPCGSVSYPVYPMCIDDRAAFEECLDGAARDGEVCHADPLYEDGVLRTCESAAEATENCHDELRWEWNRGGERDDLQEWCGSDDRVHRVLRTRDCDGFCDLGWVGMF